MKPFNDDDLLSASSVEGLSSWLIANADQSIEIAPGYFVSNLIEDLTRIETGIWNDGIDARGEDA